MQIVQHSNWKGRNANALERDIVLCHCNTHELVDGVHGNAASSEPTSAGPPQEWRGHLGRHHPTHSAPAKTVLIISRCPIPVDAVVSRVFSRNTSLNYPTATPPASRRLATTNGADTKKEPRRRRARAPALLSIKQARSPEQRPTT